MSVAKDPTVDPLSPPDRTQNAGRHHDSFWKGLLRLMRPANVVTACADILAGLTIAGGANGPNIFCLLAATCGLYAAGVVLNDVFDATLDAAERPERPIPSGLVSRKQAGILGGALLAIGIVFCFAVSTLSGLTGLALALCILLYDAAGKHRPLLGPLNMGSCRALNLFLGTTAGGMLAGMNFLVLLVPICYIAGITSLSRGEVHGGTRTAAKLSAFWMLATWAVLLTLMILHRSTLFVSLLFLLALSLRLFPPFRKALATQNARDIQIAVRTGVLSLIFLNATLAAIFAGLWPGLGLLLLYLPARLLAKVFAVT